MEKGLQKFLNWKTFKGLLFYSQKEYACDCFFVRSFKSFCDDRLFDGKRNIVA